ncbi:uncharacterized protein LOC133884951 [Phragmites australis]|uniref:uncharacterized protein LOC133884951 n=1 Tax=Phragmites australis TaxID=29695 RepID=UPI002D77B5BD|nr:uncharacterized protein LOC133884951 [Phragmites australis]
MDEFRLAMRQYTINEEFDMATEKSDSKRFRGHYKGEGCHWIIVRRRQDDHKNVKVTILEEKHDRTSSSRIRTSMASQGWVTDKAMTILQKTPNMGAKEMQVNLQDEYNVTIGYDIAWRGRERAMQELFEDWEQSFQLLYNFKAEVELRSPGNGCRPYLSIDSTALNGRWNGQLAAAAALDGHNWMFPVAFGFVGSETEDNWILFMNQLHRAIGDPPLLAVCTDARKGLENAVKMVFPNAEQRECFRHLMHKFVKKYSSDCAAHMYRAARAYKPEMFQHHMTKVLSEDPDVEQYLNKWHSLIWMRCLFNMDIKCDYINNNLVECFNNWIKDLKDFPVHDLADMIRQKIMILFDKRRRIAERLDHKILPYVLNQLKARTRGLGHLRVVWSIDWSAEVRDNNNDMRHIVKTITRECTCLEWQHTGKPYEHALAFLITQRNINLEDYVHEFYSLQKFKAAYAWLIEPLTYKS